MITYITELTNENYENITNTGLVLVDIWATWCNPCKMVSPIIDELSIDYQNKVKVCKLDADTNRDIVSSLGIRSIPTIVLLNNGQEVERLVGLHPKQKYTEIIEKYM